MSSSGNSEVDQVKRTQLWADRIAMAVVLWLVGSGLGVLVYWLIWRATSCEPSDTTDNAASCGVHPHAWAFWAGWPVLLLWVLAVLALVTYVLLNTMRNLLAEAGDASSER